MTTSTPNNFWQFDSNYWFKKLDSSTGGLSQKSALELLTLQQDLVEVRGQLQESKSQPQYLELDLQRQKELQDEDINAKKA